MTSKDQASTIATLDAYLHYFGKLLRTALIVATFWIGSKLADRAVTYLEQKNAIDYGYKAASLQLEAGKVRCQEP